MGDTHGVWDEFWADNAGAGGGGCLPAGWVEIEQAQASAWRGFVPTLPQGAKVLDLATGDGRVLHWMHGARPDLALSGIDLAPKLPPAPAGTTVQGGVSMEQLPFPDAGFDAVVSQFGFEYGDSSKVAAESARVLAPEGRVALMVHRGDGPILEHNKKRRSELLWALREKAVARKVRSNLKQGPGGIGKAMRLAAKTAEQGAAKFGTTSPGFEIPEAIRRSCLLGERAGVGSIIDTVNLIESKAKNELGRIQSLTNACATADNREVIHEAFVAHGLSHEATRPVREPSGRALADFITFH